jgi:antirestriction protein ArdC
VPLLWASATLRGFTSSSWYTFKQAQDVGACVRKGEKGTLGVFYKRITVQEDGEDKQIPVLRHFVLFNRDQIDGLAPRIDVPRIDPTEGYASAASLIKRNGIDVRHGGDRAFYTRSGDYVRLPEAGAFESIAAYWATALHEAAHWTGPRLDREFGKRFGDDAYAAEELVAEMGAAFLCARLGVEGRLQHASYIDHWIKLLKADKKAIVTAASRAREAAAFLGADETDVAMAAK